MHEGYCVAFSLTWERETDDWKKKEKKKNEDVPLSQERGSNLTRKKTKKKNKKKMRKTYIDISCSNNYAAFPDQINNSK